MTMNDDVREELELFSQVYDRLTAELSERDLPDTRRRGLILSLRSMFHLRRKCLRDAESLGAIQPADATKLRIEFARAGLAICEEQEAVIFARVHAPEQSINQRCSLVHTFCILAAMSRQLENELDRNVPDKSARRKRRSLETRSRS